MRTKCLFVDFFVLNFDKYKASSKYEIKLKIILLLIFGHFSQTIFALETYKLTSKPYGNNGFFYENLNIFDVGDLDKDGKNEMLVKEINTGRLLILKGDKTGFKIIQLLSLEGLETINDSTIGDMDNDGKNEIVAISDSKIYVFKKYKDSFKIDKNKILEIYTSNDGKESIFNTAEESSPGGHYAPNQKEHLYPRIVLN